MPDEPDKTPIRRGKGLSLSTQAPVSEAPPASQAPAPDPPEAPPEAPVMRRRGLRLSTQGAEVSPQGAEVSREAPVARRSPRRSAESVAAGPPRPDVAGVPFAPPETPAAPVAGHATAVPAPPPVAPVRWRVATATGPLSYLAAGAGDPLLLLHGFGATARIWAGTLEALGDMRSLYALDLPGCGESPPRSAAPTLGTLAEEVVAYADALGLARFDLLGHSLGAAVAAILAARHPGRVGRLVTVCLGARPAPELVALGMARGPVDLTLGLARPLLDLWQPVSRAVMQSPPFAMTLGALVLHGRPASPELWQGYLADHASADPRAYLTSLTAVGDPALHEALRAITAPTLCVVGREDRVARLPETMAAQAMIRGSTLAPIDGCGHLPMVERSAALHAAVRAFLTD